MRKLFVLLIFPFCTIGQEAEYRRITQTLCSPELHGRGYVQHGDSLAAIFLRKEFERVGMRPAATEYLQPFTFGVNTFPGAMQLQHGGRELQAGIHFLIHPESPAIRGVLRPGVLRITDLLSEEKLSARLKSVLQNDSCNALLIDLRGVAMDTVKLLKGVDEALTQVAPVIRISDEKFTWSVGRQQLPNGLILVQDSVYNPGDFFACEMDAFFEKKHLAYNVIGSLPAQRKSKKYVVFTAHYDHLGRMGRSTYFPGANDNASGSSMLVALASHFAKHPLKKYNCLFIAFAGEEAGLLGSKHFVENPLVPLKKIRFLLNLDIMGSGEDGITVVNATLFEKAFQKLQELNEGNGYLKTIKSRGPAANSDHHWFTEKKVPAFFIYTMGPNKHYHDIFDTYEELSFTAYPQIRALLIQFAETLR